MKKTRCVFNAHPLGEGALPEFILNAQPIPESDLADLLGEILHFSAVEQKRQKHLGGHKQSLNRIAHEKVGYSRYTIVRDIGALEKPIVGSIRLMATPFFYKKRLSDSKQWFGRVSEKIDLASLLRIDEWVQPEELATEELLGTEIPRVIPYYSMRFAIGEEVYEFGVDHINEPGTFAIKAKHKKGKEVFGILTSELMLAQLAESTSIPGALLTSPSNIDGLHTMGKEAATRMYGRLSFVPTQSVDGYNLLTTSFDQLSQSFYDRYQQDNLDPQIIRFYERLSLQKIEQAPYLFAWTPETHRFVPFSFSTSLLKELQ